MKRLWRSLQDYVESPAAQHDFDVRLRSFSRWWVDFARYLVAIAALQFIAEQSSNILLRLFAFVAYAALFLYCYTYLPMFVPNAWFARHPRVRFSLSLTAMLIVAALGWIILDAAIRELVDELVRVKKGSGS
jgi:hypothetical protein